MAGAPPETLRELYVEHGYGQLKLAAHYGVDRHQIRLWLAELAIPSRPKGGGGAGRAAPPTAELHRLYVIEEMTLKEIGRRYGVSMQTARRWVVDAGIPRPRRRSPRQNGRPERIPAPPRSELADLYKEQRLSAEQIGEHYGVSGATVARWLDESGFERLPASTSARSRAHAARRAEAVPAPVHRSDADAPAEAAMPHRFETTCTDYRHNNRNNAEDNRR